MILRKFIVLTIIVFAFMTVRGYCDEETHCFLSVPGINGSVQQAGFNGWTECIAFQYLLPGIPSPQRLLQSPPEKLTGILTASDVERPYATFSKYPDKIDSILNKAVSVKQKYPQWEFALVSPGGEAFMGFVFKDVTVTAVWRRDDKQYVTFKYEKVIWNYTGIKK